MIQLVVAIAQDNTIGDENSLMWHIPQDLKHFKDLTKNTTIVMGRKTLDSIGFKLPNRQHCILTNNKNYTNPLDCEFIFHSFEDALSFCMQNKNKTMSIIGGRAVYESFLKANVVDNLYLTTVKQNFGGQIKLDINPYLKNFVQVEQSDVFTADKSPRLEFYFTKFVKK